MMKSLEESDPSEDETRQEESKISLQEVPSDFGFSLASFREELDNITKSLDDEVDFHELLNEARRMSRSSETAEELVRPLPEHRFTPSGTAKKAEPLATPEPTPVKTPGSYQPFEYDDNGEFLSTVAEDETDDNDVDVEDLALIDRLDRQAHKIRRLEEENRSLREEMRSLRGANDDDRHSSPGTVFVDELVELMDLPDDQYSNLRRIMDTYFQQQQQQRSQQRLRRSKFY